MESNGHKLVAVEYSQRIQRSFRDHVRNATVDALAREPDLLSVILRAKGHASPSEPELIVPSDPEITRSMLESSKHQVRTLSSSGMVRYTSRLHWETLLEVYGDETVLRERIVELGKQDPEGLTDLLELANKYLGGWRPPEWPDDD